MSFNILNVVQSTGSLRSNAARRVPTLFFAVSADCRIAAGTVEL
jgi:hypothetical protein